MMDFDGYGGWVVTTELRLFVRLKRGFPWLLVENLVSFLYVKKKKEKKEKEKKR